jgi:hypothetical protein
MVRTYKHKSLPPSNSKEDVNTAIEIVKIGQMTIYRAAKLYKIYEATLFKHMKGSRGVKSQTLGRNQLLSPSMKRKKLQGLKLMETLGFSLSKNSLEMIGQYVNENRIPHTIERRSFW